jgi:hypothetical protein
MTLLETERLIRKMTELLQQGGNPDLALKLAGDYSYACHSANLRLQQCEAMIKAGDRHQAIQLAETAPNLLDLVTVLEFRSADDWRAFCQKNSLPPADRIDSRSVQALNECYAQGITTDHPLYAAYREAVLHRKDEDALQTLQSIARLNPADANAASELARLDGKVLAARVAQLDALLEGGDAAVIVAAIEAIEAFGFKGRPEGEVWRKAQGVRCVFLAEEVAKLKSASRWADALAKLDFVRRLQIEFQLELPGTTLKQIESFEAWARGEQGKDRKEREFSSLLAELHFRIHQSEEKDTSARYVKLPEMRDDFEALNKTWRALSEFTRPIPEDATTAFRKRSALLEAEIARRTMIRRRAIVASCAAMLVIGGAVVWFVLGQLRVKDFATQLEHAVSQRQVGAAQALLARVHGSEKRLLSAARVNAAAASAETLLSREHALLKSFDAAFAKLPSRLDGEPDAARLNAISEQFAQTKATLDALAPDLRKENEPRVQAFEKQWQQYLSQCGATANGLLEQWTSSAENQCSQLDYRAPIETAVAQVSKLSVVIQKITVCEASLTNHISLRSDLLQRAGAARAKFTAYARELSKLDEGMAALQTARSLNDYSSAISLLASSEYSGAPVASAAISVQGLGPTEETTLRSLLGATNAAKWAFIRKGKPSNFVPEIAMPAERAFFRRLDGDPALGANHQLCRLWLDREGTKSVEWITTGSFEKTEGWKRIKAWTPSASATSATFEDRDYGYFNGQWKLSPTQPIYRLEQVSDLSATSAFVALDLGKIWAGASTYGKPLLEALDVVKDSRDGSPLFRAYLLCSLVELMEFQPDAWGLSFCPSARAHVANVRTIAGGEIASGDWFVAGKAQSLAGKLEQFFTAQKSLSYTKQAAGNLAVTQAVANDGLRYVGFVGLDGKPVVTETPTPPEIWGYDVSHKAPILVANSAMPLSPLFALGSSRAEYLNKAGVSPDAPSFGNALPPMFRATAKQ